MSAWTDLDPALRARGINLKWCGNENRPLDWNIGGHRAGTQGAIITGSVKGMVHVPYTGIWHEPAYGPPRYERKVDKRREISTRIALLSDSEFGWMDTESKWWDGMDGENPGFWSVFTHRCGEMYLPMQLLECAEDELEEDPTDEDYNCKEWSILLAADGEPRWRQPDIAPAPWRNDMSITTQVRRDDELLAPMITVGVGKLKAVNRGTEPAWPVYTVTAPGRCWLPNGSGGGGQMIRVPKLNKGEHCVIDTNPEHRIVVSDKDPVSDPFLTFVDNSELLSWLFGAVGIGTEANKTVLERFHGQGFDTPIPPNTLAILPVFHDTPGARISVRLPQLFERPFS